ncbi:hypothetical protein GCM10009557_17850 [Virgisporangium ochraceum]|uniref:Nudix hydrolase domain-containing protein n=1 Tax=Virgisporangium ochraceum TaxID=65505 RepID=A0A8J4A170_9ACTN|nr:NUDIX domain-containing protein [Virgisporangium ochraceum]GIJ72682.1 hypothetical protein Voc01_075990 [Virgisporangium ochraceum]
MLPEISVSVKVAVVRNGCVLLLSYDDGEFHYNLPGGKARKGEFLRAAARRKVLEETGLPVDVRRLLFVVEYVPEGWGGKYGDVQKVQFNFMATTPATGEPRFSDPVDPMQIGFEWVPIVDLPAKYLLPQVTDRLVYSLSADGHDVLADDW